jgi:hypothetical protein
MADSYGHPSPSYPRILSRSPGERTAALASIREGGDNFGCAIAVIGDADAGGTGIQKVLPDPVDV